MYLKGNDKEHLPIKYIYKQIRTDRMYHLQWIHYELLKRNIFHLTLHKVFPRYIAVTSPMTLQFVSAKVVEVSTDMHTLKKAYESYLVRLKEYFQNADAATKSHYEKYIEQLKEKTRKRIAQEQELGKRKAIELEQELAKKDKDMEHLRDLNVARKLRTPICPPVPLGLINVLTVKYQCSVLSFSVCMVLCVCSGISEYQGVIHTLKQKMVQAESDYQRDKEVRQECSAVLTELLIEVETAETTRVNETLVREVVSEKEGLQREMVCQQQALENDKSSLERELRVVREHEMRVVAAHEADDLARRQAEVSLREMLGQLEVAAWAEQAHDHAATAMAVRAELARLEGQHAEMAAREKALAEEVEECRRQIADSNASAHSSVEALQKQCDDYVEAVNVQKEINAKLKAELKKRAAVHSATKKDAIFSGWSLMP